jgi:hypothetical protein
MATGCRMCPSRVSTRLTVSAGAWVISNPSPIRAGTPWNSAETMLYITSRERVRMQDLAVVGMVADSAVG